MSEELDGLTQPIRERMDAIDATREFAYGKSRAIIRVCATAIRQSHRGQREEALVSLQAAATEVEGLLARADAVPILLGAGFIQDAVKEYVEAAVVIRLEAEEPLPDSGELGVSDAAYVNGLAEAVMELRRHVVDRIRLGALEEAERKLNRGEEIYHWLMNFDYPDAVTLGLKRRLDTVRSVLERTRSDLFNAIRQAELERKMASLEVALARGHD
jgi:translin